ncbi:MAG: TIGR00730 family Rossman fold protein [Terriglobia bacterium]
MNNNKIQAVTVYCASSRQCDSVYLDAAERLGRELALHEITVIYGGGGGGLMGRLADSALREGGRVVGILPRFMEELEWGHRKITELVIVDDMHQRKRAMLDRADAVVALPGGCGTLEELFEAIAWKRLGLYLGPIVIVNTRSFYDPCLDLLNRCVGEHFMDHRHRSMWDVVSEPHEVIAAIRAAQRWDAANRNFAVPGANHQG